MKSLWGAAGALAALYLFFFGPGLWGAFQQWRMGGHDRPVIVQALLDDGRTVIEVAGLDRETLAWLADERTSEQWQTVLSVSVSGSDQPMLGRHSVEDNRLRFTPAFPLDPGREYTAVFSPRSPGERLTSPIRLPAVERTPTTTVAQIYPSAGLVPENQLRLYIHFSGPMGLKGGLDFVRLLDDAGQEVTDPFLPLDTEFFNGDRTRYTVFFDPGRQKRGILPNREMGPSLVEGRSYTLVVDAAWPDTNGLPLKETFRHTFRVGPADELPLDPKAWAIRAPAAGSREPLEVKFPEPLDRGLLLRALGVAPPGGGALAGDVLVGDNERLWRFTPKDDWRAGAHELVALAMLEDLAGNRIGRAFEVDQFDRSDRSPEPERTAIPFMVSRSR
jgi:hypothetical protein